MKRGIFISFALSTLLATSLFATNLEDSVAKKEQMALSNPKITFGDSAAKAKIEEAQGKLYFQSKLDAQQFAQDALKDETKRVQYSVSKEVNYQNSKFQNPPQEIIEGFDYTIQAISALEKQDLDKAKELLKRASESFDKALKANPDLQLVPLAEEIEVKEFRGDVNLIKDILKATVKLIEDYDTQAARELLLPLQDEIVIRTYFIPMNLYPLATKKAAAALNNKNMAKGVEILASALNTIVAEEVVIPIPLLVAQDLVIAASKIDKNKKEEALALLEAAKEELEKAVLLGYTKKHSLEYQSLIKEINAIEAEIKGKNEVEKLYEHILNSFKKLIDEVRGDKRAKAQVAKYQQEQLLKALKKKDEFQKQAIESAKQEKK